MSRIGNNPISITAGVTVDIQADKVVVKGKLGELEQDTLGLLSKCQMTSSLLKEILNPKRTKLNMVYTVP